RSLSSPGPGCGPDRAGARPANAVGPTTVSRPEKTPNQHRPLSCTPSSSIASSHDQAKQPKDAVLLIEACWDHEPRLRPTPGELITALTDPAVETENAFPSEQVGYYFPVSETTPTKQEDDHPRLDLQ